MEERFLADHARRAGRPIDENDLSSKAKELLADYRSVQYDMCVGKNYLEAMGFMELPKS